MAEKHGYTTEEVSAKTGEKAYDSIKDFGIAITRAKMEKNGINWFANSPSNAPTANSNNSVSNQSPRYTKNISSQASKLTIGSHIGSQTFKRKIG